MLKQSEPWCDAPPDRSAPPPSSPSNALLSLKSCESVCQPLPFPCPASQYHAPSPSSWKLGSDRLLGVSPKWMRNIVLRAGASGRGM